MTEHHSSYYHGIGQMLESVKWKFPLYITTTNPQKIPINLFVCLESREFGNTYVDWFFWWRTWNRQWRRYNEWTVNEDYVPLLTPIDRVARGVGTEENEEAGYGTRGCENAGNSVDGDCELIGETPVHSHHVSRVIGNETTSMGGAQVCTLDLLGPHLNQLHHLHFQNWCSLWRENRRKMLTGKSGSVGRHRCDENGTVKWGPGTSSYKTPHFITGSIFVC